MQISDENYHICFVAIKDTHWFLSAINKIFSSSPTVENSWTSWRAPWSWKQDDFWSRRNWRCSRNIVINFYGFTSKKKNSCLVWFVPFGLFSSTWSDIFDFIFFSDVVCSTNWNWQRYFSGHNSLRENEKYVNEMTWL